MLIVFESQHVCVVLSVPGFLQISPSKDLSFIRSIATGGDGDIVLVKLIGDMWALRADNLSTGIAKISRHRTQTKDTQLIRWFETEVSVMYYLGAKYPDKFVKLLGFDQWSATFVLKYYDYGNVRSWVESKSWNKASIYCVLKDTCQAVAAMHYEGIIHNDLKPENLLISSVHDETITSVVLSDFGLAQILNPSLLLVKEMKPFAVKGGSVAYSAPEVMDIILKDAQDQRDLKSLKAADVFSMAGIFYFAMSKHEPWN